MGAANPMQTHFCKLGLFEMASKKDQARIDELRNIADRLSRRLEECQSRLAVVHRQLELMQTRHNYTDNQIDELRSEVVNEDESI
jgi:septal ring factor EnvC (AmiA/AmiB activator)